MKIDTVQMPRMALDVGYFNIENTDLSETGLTLIQVVASGKRQLNFSSTGMTNAQMAVLLTAIAGKSSVAITEFNDPKANAATGSGTFRPLTPSATEIKRFSGEVVGWKNIKFVATEL